METSNAAESDAYAGSNSSSPTTNSRRLSLQISPLRFFQAPLSTLLEYYGVLRPSDSEAESLMTENSSGMGPSGSNGGASASTSGNRSSVGGNGEVSIRIITGDREQETVDGDNDDEAIDVEEGVSSGETSSVPPVVDSGDAGSGINRDSDSTYQRYDIQHVARWIEQILPFSLLLLVVFIRQHLQVRPPISNQGTGKAGTDWGRNRTTTRNWLSTNRQLCPSEPTVDRPPIACPTFTVLSSTYSQPLLSRSYQPFVSHCLAVPINHLSATA